MFDGTRWPCAAIRADRNENESGARLSDAPFISQT